MDRKIKITFDPAKGCDYTTEGVNYNDDWTEYEREEVYGNQLWSQVEVTELNGDVKVYPDRFHLVKSENGLIASMSNEEYEKWTGRPGSANEG